MRKLQANMSNTDYLQNMVKINHTQTFQDPTPPNIQNAIRLQKWSIHHRRHNKGRRSFKHKKQKHDTSTHGPNESFRLR